MQRVCLAIMRFCLAAWVGIAVFFVMVVIDLRQSNLFAEETKFDHPKVLFPLYYAFEFATLGPALACAVVGVRNSRVGRARKYALLLLVLGAAALAAWDYGMIYRDLLEIMNGPAPLPPAFHSLHHLSRRLNEAIVVAVAAAAVMALIPGEEFGGVVVRQTEHSLEVAHFNLDDMLIAPAGAEVNSQGRQPIIIVAGSIVLFATTIWLIFRLTNFWTMRRRPPDAP